MSKHQSFKQPSLGPQDTGIKKKRRTKREIPIPIIIPEALYAAIRTTCTVNALDENPNNKLNEHSQPILVPASRKDPNAKHALYAVDLLKKWVAYLVTQPIWCDIVETPKMSKTKFGSVVASATEVNRTSCLRLPSSAEIEEYCEGNARGAKILKTTRELLKTTLLRGDDLMSLKDMPLGTMGDPATIMSPVNICRVERMDRLAMSRYTLATADRKRWEEFYVSEKARLAYVTGMISSTRVSDKILRGLGDSESAEYNRQVVEGAIINISSSKVVGDAFDGALTVRSKGRSVNPALVQQYDIVSKSKATKDNDKINPMDMYKAMCKKYRTLTGHQLDPKEEKKGETYSFRMGDIEWAEELRVSRPSYRFVHYAPTDRIRATEGLIRDEDLKPEPRKQETKSGKSSKMIGLGSKYPFTNSSVYSNSKPQTKMVNSAVIHKIMNNDSPRKKEEESDSESDDEGTPYHSQESGSEEEADKNASTEEDEEDVYYGSD